MKPHIVYAGVGFWLCSMRDGPTDMLSAGRSPTRAYQWWLANSALSDAEKLSSKELAVNVRRVMDQTVVERRREWSRPLPHRNEPINLGAPAPSRMAAAMLSCCGAVVFAIYLVFSTIKT